MHPEERRKIEQAPRGVLRNVARDFAALYRAENARFDDQRFYEACGLNNIGTGWALRP